MDRNQLTGLILMLVFITVYFTFLAPEPPIPNPETPASTEVVKGDTNPEKINQARTLSDSARLRLNELKYGLFSPLAAGEQKTITVENEQMIVTLSNQGGTVNKIVLKEFQDFRGEPLVLLDEDHAQQHFYIEHLSKQVDLSELYFSSGARSQKIDGTDTLQFSYVLTMPSGEYITFKYSIPGTGYNIGMKVEQVGFENLIDDELMFAWSQKMNRLELDFKDARNRSTVKFYYVDGEVDELSATSTDKEEEPLALPTTWVSFRQKFFTSAIISKTPFQTGSVASYIDYSDSSSIKNVSMNLKLDRAEFLDNQLNFDFFYGPNNYTILSNVAPEFGQNVELGWFIMSWINKFAIIPLFHFLERFIPSYGIIIIIMVFAIRIVLSPLTYTSHMGMAKMRVMKPELDEIKARNGDDATKAQQEQMALYQKVGINPLAGCIPMLLQMPILFAMFYFFPNSIELRQQSFLWATDLSTYDSILNLPFVIPFYGDHVSLFTLLMTASTILYTWSNSQMTTVQGPMKTMQYVMPVMFLFFLNSYSSGLTFYYFVSNIVSFGQIALFRKFIDEDKIKNILEENKKKNANKKKSSFQQRLDEAMKAQQNKKTPKKK